MLGQGLQHLLTSPMAGGQQQQFPDPTDIVKQLMEQFTQHLMKKKQAGELTAPLAMGGGIGAGSGSGMPPIQAPVGTPPREEAGRMRSAGMQGVGTMMEQAGETAAEPWKPQALDIGLMGAAVAMQIIAAMQPEGRGRRGQRRQQRTSGLFRGLGDIAQKGLGMRMKSFETGRAATYGAAQDRAELESEAIGAKYEHEIGRIGAERKAFTEDRSYDIAKGYLGIAGQREERLGLPQPEKEPFTPTQLYRQGRDIASDTRKQTLIEANQIIQSLDLGGQRFVIKSVQDLDSMIFELEQGDVLSVTRGLPPMKAPPRTNVVAPILARLKELRDQYDTGVTGGGQTGKPPDMTDAEWQEYQQMKGQ